MLPQRQHFDRTIAVLETTADSLQVMMEQERTAYACQDYLHSCGDDHIGEMEDLAQHQCSHQSSKKLSPGGRMRVVDWAYDIVDRCHFDRDTVAIAMNLFDRYMAKCPQDTLGNVVQCQLVAMAAIYISIKTNEPVLFSSRDFEEISRGIYSVSDIEEMEWRILTGLEWRLSPPTSFQIGHRLLTLMHPRVSDVIDPKTWSYLREEAAYMNEHAVRSYAFTTKRPSTVAAASILNSIEKVDDRSFEHLMRALLGVLQEFDFDAPDALLQTRHEMRCLTRESEIEYFDVVEEEDVSIETSSRPGQEKDNGFESRISYSEHGKLECSFITAATVSCGSSWATA